MTERRKSLAARVALALLAATCAAWLIGGLVAVDHLEQGPRELAGVGEGPERSAALKRMASEFDAARRFAPDAEVDLKYALTLVTARETERAAVLAAAAVRREPENFDAWLARWATTRDRDAATASAARARALELDPSSAELFEELGGRDG